MSIRKSMALAAVLAPALAVSTIHSAEPGFYVGGSYGQSTLKIDDLNIDDEDGGWKAFAGYNFLPWLGVEGGYVDLGSTSGNIRNNDNNINFATEADLTGWQAFVVGTLPLGDVDMFLKLGGISAEAEADARNRNTGEKFSDSESDEYLAYGGGITYIFNHQWAIRAEVEAYDVDDVDDSYLISAGVTYHFGGRKKKQLVPVAVIEECSDTDNDGVCDTYDICPKTPTGSRVDPQGCNCDYVLELEFSFNSDELHAEDIGKLDALVPVLTDPQVAFIAGGIDGYTDNMGDAIYNLDLSKRRAETVANHLRSNGVKLSDRFAVNGHGEAYPVAGNDTMEGRAKNRRVEIRRTDCEALH
jgi:outer membrane protein OmpA-like peptidoglycan-associated protein